VSRTIVWMLIIFFVLDAIFTVYILIRYAKKKLAKTEGGDPSKCPVCGYALPVSKNTALLRILTCTNCGAKLDHNRKLIP